MNSFIMLSTMLMKYEHPWIWLEMILENNNISLKDFSEMIKKPLSEIEDLIGWKKNIDIEWAYTICRVFWWNPQTRINLQNKYDEQQYKLSKQYQNLLCIKKYDSYWAYSLA